MPALRDGSSCASFNKTLSSKLLVGGQKENGIFAILALFAPLVAFNHRPNDACHVIPRSTTRATNLKFNNVIALVFFTEYFNQTPLILRSMEIMGFTLRVNAALTKRIVIFLLPQQWLVPCSSWPRTPTSGWKYIHATHFDHVGNEVNLGHVGRQSPSYRAATFSKCQRKRCESCPHPWNETLATGDLYPTFSS